MPLERRPFRDRTDAGRQLASLLASYAGRADVVVLGLPRGGVPVAAAVATRLQAPLDVFVVRKLGVPGHDELAMGAIASGGVRVLNRGVISDLNIPDEEIERVTERESDELHRRITAYRQDRLSPQLAGKVVIVVDDGLATGSTMRAAVAALRSLGPSRIVVAVPVGSPITCADLADEADEVVCARTPRLFHAVGQWYDDFLPTTDDEIRDLLAESGAA
jgi:predicted phosphoribosyltransferase